MAMERRRQRGTAMASSSAAAAPGTRELGFWVRELESSGVVLVALGDKAWACVLVENSEAGAHRTQRRLRRYGSNGWRWAMMGRARLPAGERWRRGCGLAQGDGLSWSLADARVGQDGSWRFLSQKEDGSGPEKKREKEKEKGLEKENKRKFEFKQKNNAPS